MKSCGSFSGEARAPDHTYLGRMGVTRFRRRLLCVAALSGLLAVPASAQSDDGEESVWLPDGTAVGSPEADVARDVADEAEIDRDDAGKRRLPVVGLMADAGLPDGFMGSLTVRPIPYLRLHAGAGANTSSPGVRGGLTLLPLGTGPSLSLEVGHYLDGEANGLVRRSVAGLGRFASYVHRLNYTFANAHAGIDIGERGFTFFIHGGFTYLRARLRDVQAPPDMVTSTGRTSIAFKEDPIIKMFTPSLKVGLIVYLQ